MENTLLTKGIILQSGEVNKDKVNLVAGAITQSLAEMVWLATGGDMERIQQSALQVRRLFSSAPVQSLC